MVTAAAREAVRTAARARARVVVAMVVVRAAVPLWWSGRGRWGRGRRERGRLQPRPCRCLALRRLRAAGASGYLTPRPAWANQPLGRRWPATRALLCSTCGQVDLEHQHVGRRLVAVAVTAAAAAFAAVIVAAADEIERFVAVQVRPEQHGVQSDLGGLREGGAGARWVYAAEGSATLVRASRPHRRLPVVGLERHCAARSLESPSLEASLVSCQRRRFNVCPAPRRRPPTRQRSPTRPLP